MHLCKEETSSSVMYINKVTKIPVCIPCYVVKRLQTSRYLVSFQDE